MSDKMYFSELFQSLRTIISGNSPTAIFLEAGHFDPRYAVDQFSKASLEDALQITKLLVKEYGKNVKIVLGVLVDDLGLDCSGNVCSISKDAPKITQESERKLPSELENIFTTSPFYKKERLVISSERTCKNRGLNKLKKFTKHYHQDSNIEINKSENKGKVSFKDNENNDILLAEFIDDVWKAKCPTIMGQHYIDCFNLMRQRFANIEQLIVIDWTEMLDYSKVTAGSQAAMKVFKNEEVQNLNLTIFNIFFGDNIGELYEIKSFNNLSFDTARQ
jgi:hypothetical protein